MPISTRYLIQTTSAFLIIGFLALISVVGMNFWLANRAQVYFDNAIAARDTRAAAVELRSAMQTAESSQRGFIITGNEIYLAPYRTAKARSKLVMAMLQVVLQNQNNSDLALQRLDAILNTKFKEFDRTIELKRDRRDDEVLAIFRTNSGKALTDEANVFFAGIIGKADERLTSGVIEQRANTNLLRIMSAIASLVIVAVVAGAVFGVSRYTKELRKTHSELNALNNELEQRVAVRTEDLARSRDRAEVLLAEVNHRVANSLALVSGLLNLQIKAVVDPAAGEALAETQERIFAISLVHKRLYDSSDVHSVALKEYLTVLLDHLGTSLRSKHNSVVLAFNIEPIELETDLTINLGVVITELVTNAFKYAYPTGGGEIRVFLHKLPNENAQLVVEDDGIGRGGGKPAKGTGVGSKIVSAMCISLGTHVDYLELGPGTSARIEFSTKLRRSVITPKTA